MRSSIEKIIECIIIRYYEGEEVSLPIVRLSDSMKDNLWREVAQRLGFPIAGDSVLGSIEAAHSADQSESLALGNYAFLRIDIVEYLRIMKRYEDRQVSQTFDRFALFVADEVDERGGEIWDWCGDIGLCVFRDHLCEDRATLCAVSILTGMQIFNMERNLLDVNLDISLAIHSEYVTEGSDRREVSHFISRFDEIMREGNRICISDNVFEKLSERIKKCFSPEGTLGSERIYVYTS